MADRAEIAKRHGLAPHVAANLHGETAEELEADAAARAAIAQMLADRETNESVETAEPTEEVEDSTDEQVLGASISAVLAAKNESYAAFVRAVHGGGEDE